MTDLDMPLVLEARRALEGRIRRTPIEPSAALSEAAGIPVFLKLECLQLTGSFKIRGAVFVLSRLDPEDRRRGVVTCSAGNHGKAVAHVARELGIPAEIHVPRGVDESKYQGMLALGARVVRSDFEGFDETERVAREEAARSGRPFLTAFDDAQILAANGGTLAAEVLEDCPGARAFLLPVGGAGLAGGFAYYAKTALPDARIIGCQHALSPALALSLERGEAVLSLPPVATTAGGLEGGIGRTGFEVLRPRCDAVALLTEDEIFEAVRFVLDRHQYLIEPSSAVTVAAILTGKAGRLEAPAVAVISGRNVALPTLRTILAA
ncbi:MAG TPA: pyridoxal-phosphate dependent enzyme [Thermoanaerobaculia bacterium]|nr:pyridoxal-phosphate dependent enzyme [Thermoanaerobaculia bacterium]